MSITLDQIILDAQRIANRLKDREMLGNAVLVEAEGVNRQLETMKQFQDDIDSLNLLSRDKSNADMVNRINQQNPSIREIRQENRELKACIEDHQRALEHIMQKYREHTQHKIFTSRINLRELYNAKLSDVVQRQAEKINEMAAVMQHAAAVDSESVTKEIECIARLRIENEGLREMLEISRQFNPTAQPQSNGSEHKAIQTDVDSSCSKIVENGVEECNGTVINTKMEKIDNNQQKEQITAMSNGENNNNNSISNKETSMS